MQFKDTAAHLHGFETLHLSAYGIQQCPELEGGACAKIADESALDIQTTSQKIGADTTVIKNEEAAAGSEAGANQEQAAGAATPEGEQQAAPASPPTEQPKPAEGEKAPTEGPAEADAMQAKVDNLSKYVWSFEATPLKDSIYNLLNTLMQVDMKYKEFSAGMAADEDAKKRLEIEMENLQKSLQDINSKISGKQPEQAAANNYKEILRAADQQINTLNNGMTAITQISGPNQFLEMSSKSMLQLSADLLSRAQDQIRLEE